MGLAVNFFIGLTGIMHIIRKLVIALPFVWAHYYLLSSLQFYLPLQVLSKKIEVALRYEWQRGSEL